MSKIIGVYEADTSDRQLHLEEGFAIMTEEIKGMKFLITVYQDEDGNFIAECPSIPGCVSQGKTLREAEKNIREAIKACLEVRAERGMPLTITVKQIDVHV